MSEPRTTPDALSRGGELREWLAGAEGLVLGLDFDGTLAPIVEDHTEATLTTESRAALDRLAERPGVALALVSGRALDDLTGRVEVEGAVYAGNHGLELEHGGERTVHPDVEGLAPEVDRLCAELDERLGDVPGYAVENKRVTATVHYRNVPGGRVPHVVETVEAVVDEADGLRVSEGKEIRELRPAVDWDKGRVMDLLVEASPGDWRAMYVGDDTTDEDAFRAIQPDGVGVHVAPDGDEDDTGDITDAAYRLDGQAAVPRLLEWLDVNAPRPDATPDGAWPGDGPLSLSRVADARGTGPRS